MSMTLRSTFLYHFSAELRSPWSIYRLPSFSWTLVWINWSGLLRG